MLAFLGEQDWLRYNFLCVKLSQIWIDFDDCEDEDEDDGIPKIMKQMFKMPDELYLQFYISR